MGEVGTGDEENLHEVWEDSMKIDIAYEYNKGDGTCWAKSFVHDQLVMSCGTSFAIARERHVNKIKDLMTRISVVVPETEKDVEV